MSDGAELDDDSQEQAVGQQQNETPGCSSSSVRSTSTSYKGRNTNIHFQVILKEENEEFILMDDWMCIDTSSSDDDEPSNMREKGATPTSVPISSQAQASPVSNITMNETTVEEEENIVHDLNAQEKMKDPSSTSVPVETPALVSPKNTSSYSTEVTASNCMSNVLSKETDDTITSVDVHPQMTDNVDTCSSLSTKERVDSCLMLDTSEVSMVNSDNECISSAESEDIDMREFMPSSSLSCSEPITHKVKKSGKETTELEPCNVVTPRASGSPVPGNSSMTETYDALPKQSSSRDLTCVTLPDLDFNSSVHETPLISKSTNFRKKSVDLELSDKSIEKMCNWISNCGDDFKTKDVIIISDDEDGITTEFQNLNETSDISSVCVKDLSVSASQFSSELPKGMSTKGDTREILEHQTDFTYISDVTFVTVGKVKEMGSDVKKMGVLSCAKADSQCLSQNKYATLEGDLPSSLSTVEDHQQLRNLNKDYDHERPSVVRRVGDHNQPSSINGLDYQQHSNHQQRSSLSRLSDNQQSPDSHYDDHQHSSLGNEVDNHQCSPYLNKTDNHQEQYTLHGVASKDTELLQPMSTAGQKMQAPKSAEQTVSIGPTGHKAPSMKSVLPKPPSGKLPELTPRISGHQKTQIQNPTKQQISTVKPTEQQTPSLKYKVQQISGKYSMVKVGAENEIKNMAIVKTKEQHNSSMKLTLHRSPSGAFEVQSNFALNTTEKQTPALEQNAVVKQTSPVKAPSGNILLPTAQKTGLSQVKSSAGNITVPFGCALVVDATPIHTSAGEAPANRVPSVMAQGVKRGMGHLKTVAHDRLRPSKSLTTATSVKVPATDKLVSKTATDKLSIKATANYISPVNGPAKVRPAGAPANITSPVKGHLKASEYNSALKKMRTRENYVTSSFIIPSHPFPDSTIPDSVHCRDKKCSRSPEPLNSTQKSIPEATRVRGYNKRVHADKQSGNSFVIEGLKVISKVISSLGPLGSAVEHLLHQSKLVLAEGKDPLELFLVKDNIILLDLINQKLSSQIEEKLLPPDLFGSSENALKMTYQLLEAANQFRSKEKYLGLDIDAIAKATYGTKAHEISTYVKKSIKYQGKKEAKDEDLQIIIRAVISKQNKLTAQIVVNNSLNSTSASEDNLAAKASEISDDRSRLSKPSETLNTSLSRKEKTHQISAYLPGICTTKENEDSSALTTFSALLPSTSSTTAVQLAKCLQSKPQTHLISSKPRSYSNFNLPTYTQDGRQGTKESSLVFNPSGTSVYHSNDLRSRDKDLQISSKIKEDLLSKRKRTSNGEKSFYKTGSVFNKQMSNDRKHSNRKCVSDFDTFARQGKTDYQRIHCRSRSRNQNAVQNQGHWRDTQRSVRISETANNQNSATISQAGEGSCSRSISMTDESAYLGCGPHGISQRQGRIVTERPFEGRTSKNETKGMNPVKSTNFEFNQPYKNFTPLSHKDTGSCEKNHLSGPRNIDFHQNYGLSAVPLRHNHKAVHVDGHHTQKRHTQDSHRISKICSLEESDHSGQPSCSEGTSYSHKTSADQDLHLHDMVNLLVNFHDLPAAEQQALMKYLENLKATSPAAHQTLFKMLGKRGSL